MKLADSLSMLFAFLSNTGLPGTAEDNAVWLITGYSTALGLALTTALFSARQRIVFARASHRKPLYSQGNGNT